MSKLVSAQAALGVALIEREACGRERLASAMFEGPLRTTTCVSRPTLVIAPGNRETEPRLIESSDSAVFSVLVDGYYIAASKARGRPPRWLFEKKDGGRKSGSYVSLMISSFTESAGIRLPPTVVRERRVQNQKRAGRLNNEMLRDFVGASNNGNARHRYSFLDQLDAASEFSRGRHRGDDEGGSR